MEVPFQQGMTFGFYARRGVYSSPWAKEQIRKMKQLNVEYVALIATVFTTRSISAACTGGNGMNRIPEAGSRTIPPGTKGSFWMANPPPK